MALNITRLPFIPENQIDGAGAKDNTQQPFNRGNHCPYNGWMLPHRYRACIG